MRLGEDLGLLRKSLNTDLISVARLRLNNLEKSERRDLKNKNALCLSLTFPPVA